MLINKANLELAVNCEGEQMSKVEQALPSLLSQLPSKASTKSMAEDIVLLSGTTPLAYTVECRHARTTLKKADVGIKKDN